MHALHGHYHGMQLEEWMLKNEISDEGLAGMIGRDRASVSRIRRGKQMPSGPTMAAIMRATGGQVMPNDLVFGA